MEAATLTNEQLIAELEQRVEGLYQMNAALSAEVDRMRPVVDAARRCGNIGLGGWVQLKQKVDAYDTAMAQLAKGGTRQ